MGVPKKHTTSSQVGRRRANIFIKNKKLTLCLHCNKPALPHTVCANCGYYKGVEVLNVLGKLEKKERKKREKEIKETGGEETAKKEKPMTLEELSKKKF